MRKLSLLVALIAVAVGCSKKPAKPTASPDDAAARPPAASPEKPKVEVKPQAEKPNWLDDPRYNGKGEGGALPVESPNGGKLGLGVTLPPVNTSPVPQPGIGVGQPLPPATGTPGKLSGVPAPAVPTAPVPPSPVPPATGTSGKMVTKADMNEVWIFIENASLNIGKMPPPEVVYAALVKADATAAKLVKSNDIILTGATTRESVWAYERNAPTQGGWIATQNGPEQVTAKEFAQRLGR